MSNDTWKKTLKGRYPEGRPKLLFELLLQTFVRFFLSRFILMSFFISYIFLRLMGLLLMEGFFLNAQEGYRSLFFKDAG